MFALQRASCCDSKIAHVNTPVAALLDDDPTIHTGLTLQSARKLVFAFGHGSARVDTRVAIAKPWDYVSLWAS